MTSRIATDQVLLRRARWIGTALALQGSLLAAHGQNLPLVPGYTPVQQPTATAVQTVCSSFAANTATYGAASDSGSPAQRLFSSCRKMVQTANQLVGSGATANSLGLSNEDLRNGVQAIAPVQMNAQRQMTAEASRNNIVFSRLLDLRGGSRGLSLSLNDGSQQVAASGDAPAARGGGASADTAIGEKWGAFVNAGYTWGDVAQTALQDRYDLKNWGIVGGVDYRLAPNGALGMAASYQRTKSDFAGDLGSVKANAFSLAAYGTYYGEGFYLDGLLSYGWINYDTARTINIASTTAIAPINAVATASPKGKQVSAVLGGGYNWVDSALTVTPFARLGSLHVRNEAFSETEPVSGLGLAVDERTVRSLQSALGVRLQQAYGTSFGVVTPYVSAQWNHEFHTQQSSITSKYVNDPFNVFFTIPTEDAGSNYGVIVIGLSGQFERGMAAFVQYSTATGLKNVTNHTLAAGLRLPF